MPKERIWGRRSECGPNNDMTVGWGRSEVKFENEENDGNVELTIGNIEVDPAVNDRDITPSDMVEREIASISLNRTSVNRLIRTLRRARDSAFGADA